MSGHLRRSPVEGRLAAAGATFAERDGGMVAAHLGRPDAERAAAATLALADLSPLPRWGLKGPGTIEWATAQGVVVPGAPQQAAVQPGGGTVLRLAPRELFWLGCGTEAEAAWEAGSGPRGWPLLRAHSHAWFALVGSRVPELLATLCSVDLRPHRFAEGAVAQTRALGLSVIIVRAVGSPWRWDVLLDSASAGFAWDALRAEMAVFDGAVVGLDALA